MNATYQEWRDWVTDGGWLQPYHQWSNTTNLHRLWNSRIKPDDPRWRSCGGDPHLFTRKVYDWLQAHLDTFLQAVYDSAFTDRGWRAIVATEMDSNTVANTPLNPGYFRNRCYRDVVVCGGDGDRTLSIKDAIVNTLRGEVRKTFTMPAVWPDIMSGTVSSNMVLTFNKSCKLASVFSPGVYRYLLCRAQRHSGGSSVLFGTASWGVPIVAAEDCGYKRVGIVDVQSDVLRACVDIHSERRPAYTLQTYHTPSERMTEIVPGGWDHIISCPPYWDLEVYGGSDQQSTDLYSSYDEWLRNYWQRTVEESMRLLHTDGVFAFTMGRWVRYQWCAQDMTRIAEECGLQVIDTVRIMPRRKTPKLYATSTEKWEECIYFRRK